MRYVTLATDRAPTYAVWVPVAARLWERCGYGSIVLLNEREPDEDDATARCWARIRAELTAVSGVTGIVTVRRTGRLTVANTMRCSRLAASAIAELKIDDFLLTSDADMLPLSTAFFDRREPFVVLRPFYDVWLRSLNISVPIDITEILAGEFRFPMCYAGALVGIWREILPQIAVGDVAGSLARLVSRPDAVDDPATGRHATDLDETILSHAFLASPRAQGEVVRVAPDVWKKGELTLVEPMTAPTVSIYKNAPRGLLILNDFWAPDTGRPAPDGVIDYIPGRFKVSIPPPWTCFDVVATYVPEIAAWLDAYRIALEPLLTEVERAWRGRIYREAGLA